MFAPWRTSEPPGPGVDSPVSPAGYSPRSEQGSPKFLGNLDHPFAMFQTDAGRTADTRPSGAAAWPLVIERQRLPRWGLSTLNSMAFGLAVYASPSSLPPPTQNSLPVAGQALLDGVLTRKVPMKGFKVVDYISSPFPKLCLAQSMQPPATRTILLASRLGKILINRKKKPPEAGTRRQFVVHRRVLQRSPKPYGVHPSTDRIN